MSSLINHDLEYLNTYDYMIGIDEVGRGCLAGPLVVCGVIMKYDNLISEINDSKKLSALKRERLEQVIKDNVFDYLIIEVDVQEVDDLNVYVATKKAMNEIALKLSLNNTLVLSDAMPLTCENNISLIKGDSKSYAIACASILAKVYRDNLLIELDGKHPEYGFKNHKGYGTKQHMEALKEYGYLEDIHRKTFEPIKSMIKQQLRLFD